MLLSKDYVSTQNFNVNLTKFVQSDVKGKNIFFLQIWSGVSSLQTSKEEIVITQKVNIFVFDSPKKKKKNYNIVVNAKNKKLKGSTSKVK